MKFSRIKKTNISNLEPCSKLTSEGTPGDGDGTQGNCESGELCCPNRVCSSEKCSRMESGGVPGDGDGLVKGNCPGAADICKSNGCCEGIIYYKKYYQCFILYY